MGNDKTVAEMLREKHANLKERDCWAFPEAVGKKCRDFKDCTACAEYVLNALADAIEAEQAELRDENERLRKDFYEPLASMGFTEHARALAATYNFACEQLLMINKQIETDMRPEPEVLDADNVPIAEGDTVWHEDEGECVVERIYRQNGDTLLDLDVCGAVWNMANVKPAEVTHRKPDTQEAINADCWVDAKDYCEKYGVKTEWPKHYGKAKCEHLLARQRKLLGGE